MTRLLPVVREDLKEFSKEFDKSEEDLKSLQSGVGQIVGEVLRQLTEDKCEWVWFSTEWAWFTVIFCH